MPALSLFWKVVRRAVENGADIKWANDYAERGCSKYGDGPILLANWNPRDFGEQRTGHPYRAPVHTPESRIGAVAQRLGVDIEWSDEWATCGGCARIVRTEPDSYSWRPSYAILPDGVVCRECVAADIGEYEAQLANNPDRCDTFDIDWSARRWTRVPHRYESGFHTGQTDSPRDVFDTLSRSGKYDVLFTLDTAQQFDCYWSAWIRPTKYRDE